MNKANKKILAIAGSLLLIAACVPESPGNSGALRIDGQEIPGATREGPSPIRLRDQVTQKIPQNENPPVVNEPFMSDVQRSNASPQINDGFGDFSVRLVAGEIGPRFCDVVSFQNDAYGQPILPGQDLTNAYQEAGITMVSYPNADNCGTPGCDVAPVIAFDSSNPSGEDPDLGTPNEAYGGPGIGEGIGNDTALGNIAIIPEDLVDDDNDGLVDDPDDEANGGMFEFEFTPTRCIGTADLIDIEGREVPAQFIGLDENGQEIGRVTAGGLGDNSVEQVEVGLCGVKWLQVQLRGSGAVHDLHVCDGPDSESQMSLGTDLLDVKAVDFTVETYAHGNGAPQLVSTAAMTMSPALLIMARMLPGQMDPITLSSLPVGNYNAVSLEIGSVVAIFNDGTRTAIPVSMSHTEPFSFSIMECGETMLKAEYLISPRFDGDLFDCGVSVEFHNMSETYDPASCTAPGS